MADLEDEAEQQNIVALVKSDVGDQMDQAEVRRYCRAYAWDSRVVLREARHTIKWRLEFKPQDTTPLMVKQQIDRGLMFVHGKGHQGHPIVYTLKRIEVDPEQTYEMETRFLVWTMERAIEAMPEGIDQWIWVLDLTNYSRGNSPPMSVTKETLHILQHHFPDRLNTIIIVNAPWVFSFAFKMVSPFINARTKEKINWIYGEYPSIGSQLEQWIKPDEIFDKYK